MMLPPHTNRFCLLSATQCNSVCDSSYVAIGLSSELVQIVLQVLSEYSVITEDW